ncbi:MAG: hypothetical protein N2234_08420 [Planctomycetota bacterium]|nr:hypothetical protein [Planctomycetota bacterium]
MCSDWQGVISVFHLMSGLKEFKRRDVVAVRVSELGVLASIRLPQVPENAYLLVEEGGCFKKVEKRRLSEGAILVKSASQDVDVRVENLCSLDGVSFGVALLLSIKIAADDMDADSFGTSLGGRSCVCVEDLATLIATVLRKYFEEESKRIELKSGVSPKEQEQVLKEAVCRGFKEVRFRYGIALEEVKKCEIVSEGYERLRPAILAAEEKVSQIAVLKRCGLEEKEAKEVAIELRSGKTTRMRRLFLACENSLLVFDPESLLSGSGKPVKRIKETLPIRSLKIITTSDGNFLTLGLLDRVVLYDLETLRRQREYSHDADTTHGFNSVAATNEHIYGSHSQFGLLRWSLEEGKAEHISKRGARGVCISGEGKVYFSSGDSLYIGTLPPKEVFRCVDEIQAIVPYDSSLVLACKNGEIFLFRPPDSLLTKHNIGAKLYSAALAELPSGDAVLVGAKTSGLYSISLISGKITVFESSESLRLVAGATDIVTGVSYSLRSLLLWETGLPSKPKRVPLSSEAVAIEMEKEKGL